MLQEYIPVLIFLGVAAALGLVLLASGTAHAQVAVDADHVYLRKDCSAFPTNCFTDLDDAIDDTDGVPELIDWIWNVRTPSPGPASPLLVDVGRYAEAIVQLEQAMILEPEHGHAALLLATAFREVGEPDEALRVLGSAPCGSWPEGMVLAAEIVAADRPTDALELVDRVLAADPGHVEARRVRDQLA